MLTINKKEIMKRLLFLLLLVLTTIAGWAQTEFTVGNFKYTVTDDVNHYVSVSQNSENAPSGAITIPSSVTYETVTYTVTSIANSGFYMNEDITEVTIPNTVTSIGENAFVTCSKLTTITLPSTLTTIGNYAFFQCSSLASFSVPGSVTTIGSMVFDYCSIPTFTFEASNSAITCNSGIPCTNHLYLYRDIEMDGTLTTTIKSLTIGAHVTTIYNNMFNGSQYLNSIDFSEATGLTSIGDHAFDNCGNYVPTEPGEDPVPNLTAIDLSNTKVTSIGQSAFISCSKLETITLPSTLTTIGNYAFFSCSSLTSFSVPGSVETIGSMAFDYCSIPTFTFEASNTAITCGSGIPCSNLYLGRDITFTEYGFLGVSALTIGTNVTSIGSLFYYSNITSVTVPWDSPITIDDDAFSDETFTKATLWIPGGTKATYEAANGWKKFTNMDFSSFVVKITGSAHGTLEVGEISSTNNETATTLIDRGKNAVFTVTPATGYEASTFTVNGEAAALTDNSYTVENLSADQTVVANFTAISYTIGYDLAGGSVASANPTSYTIESSAITLNNPTKTGYTFAGWTGTGLAEPTTSVTIAAGSTGDRSYTATWTPTEYNITLTLDGGTAVNPTTYTILSEDITLNNPTKTGYTFKGWKLNGVGEAQMTVTITTGSTGDKAYTATWQVNQYTITFNSNGGSDVDPITQDYGTVITSPNNPTRTGYDFNGWNPAVPATMPAENMTVVAQWTKATYTVTITGSGVTADNTTPEYGANVVLTIMDDPDAELISLTVNGNNVTSSIVDHQYTITSVSGNVSVVATWILTKEFITLATSTATFSCEQDLNFTGSELKAYIAAGYSKSGNGVLLVRVYDVPRNTGLVIRGEVGPTYKIPYSTSQSYFVNLLKEHLNTDNVPATSDDENYYNYVLKRDGDVYSWHRPGSGSGDEMKLGAKKAYLQLPKSFMTAAAARELNLVFEDDSTTDISEFILLNNGKAGNRIYNLNGQQVDNMRKGVYIVNGRKVMK